MMKSFFCHSTHAVRMSGSTPSEVKAWPRQSLAVNPNQSAKRQSTDKMMPPAMHKASIRTATLCFEAETLKDAT
jgi:hypothetical protein